MGDAMNPFHVGAPPRALAFGALFAVISSAGGPLRAQPPTPTLVDPNLAVRRAVGDLVQPIHLAFLGPDDLLVLQKASGRVLRIVNGGAPDTVLDLAVNSASERGLLSIALHPDFPTNPGVYLFWTESFADTDTTDFASVPLLGNRVDRFLWDGSTLTWEQNLIRLRAFQADMGQPLRANQNGGVIRFGPGRQALHSGGRHRPARPDAESGGRALGARRP